jgi:hypothetical protein
VNLTKIPGPRHLLITFLAAVCFGGVDSQTGTTLKLNLLIHTKSIVIEKILIRPYDSVASMSIAQ